MFNQFQLEDHIRQAGNQATVTGLAISLKATTSDVQRALRIMQENGLVEIRRKGSVAVYRLTPCEYESDEHLSGRSKQWLAANGYSPDKDGYETYLLQGA